MNKVQYLCKFKNNFILGKTVKHTIVIMNVEGTDKKINMISLVELSLFKEVPLRTRRAILLYKVYCDSALLVLNRTSLTSDRAPLALN